MDHNILAIRNKIWREVDKELAIFDCSFNQRMDLKSEMIKTQMGLIRIALDTAEISGAGVVERELQEIERTMQLIEARYGIGNYSRIIDIIRTIDKEALGQAGQKKGYHLNQRNYKCKK